MVRIWCQKVACAVCGAIRGNGWLLVGDALRSCVNTGISVRGMDMALTGAQAAAQTLISACQHREPQNLFPLYHHNVERSLLWDVLQRYQHVPALLQRPGWYRVWSGLMQDISRDLWDQGIHLFHRCASCSGVIYVVTACGI